MQFEAHQDELLDANTIGDHSSCFSNSNVSSATNPVGASQEKLPLSFDWDIVQIEAHQDELFGNIGSLVSED